MKHVIIGVSDAVYDRLLLLAQAAGKTLSEWARDALDIPRLERTSTPEFEAKVTAIAMDLLKKESQWTKTKHIWHCWILKQWKNGNRRLVFFRWAPYPEYDARVKGEPEKAGQYLLRVVIEDKHGQVKKEERVFRKTLKMYRRTLDSLLVAHGYPPRYQRKAKATSPTGTANP